MSFVHQYAVGSTGDWHVLAGVSPDARLRVSPAVINRLKRERQDFFVKFGPEARAVLNDLQDKYTEHGATQLQFPDALKIPPISERGSTSEIARYLAVPINCGRPLINRRLRQA